MSMFMRNCRFFFLVMSLFDFGNRKILSSLNELEGGFSAFLEEIIEY